MEAGKHSITALHAAFMRAYHAAHARPPIFADAYAYLLLSAAERASIEARLIEDLHRLDPALAASCPDRQAALSAAMRALPSPAHIVVRARYAEDTLAKAMPQGLLSYVIIGAGMDTFALRHPELHGRLQVVELDHPATQAFKRQRLAEVGLPTPPHLRFVPVDLEQENLAIVLSGLAFEPGIPVFCSWLGVTAYLSPTAILETLRAISRATPAGSHLVFDYLDADAFTAEKSSARVRQLLERLQHLGEPMRSGVDTATLREALSAIGLQLIEELGPEALQQRYFGGRTDGLRAREHSHVAWVRSQAALASAADASDPARR